MKVKIFFILLVVLCLWNCTNEEPVNTGVTTTINAPKSRFMTSEEAIVTAHEESYSDAIQMISYMLANIGRDMGVKHGYETGEQLREQLHVLNVIVIPM